MLEYAKALLFILLGVLGIVALSVIAWAVIKLVKTLLGKVGLEMNDTMMMTIENLVKKVVKLLNQKLTSVWKAAAVDGKLTEEQAETIYNRAVELITEAITDEQKELLEQKFGNIDLAFEILIESAVDDEHKTPSAPSLLIGEAVSAKTSNLE